MKFVRQYAALLAFVMATLIPLNAKAGLIIDPSISSWSDQDHIDFALSLPVTQFTLFTYAADGISGSISSGYAITDGNSIGIKTARHAYFDPSGNLYDRFEFRLGENYNNPDYVFQLDPIDLYLNPGDTDQAIAFPDFGTASDQIKAATNWEGDRSTLEGTDFVFSGYGRTGNTTVGFTGSDGNLRAGVNLHTGSSPFAPSVAFTSILFPPSLPSSYRESAILAGPGDSGGFAGIIVGNEAFSYGTLKGGSGHGFFAVSNFHYNDNSWDQSVFASRGSSVPEPSSLFLIASGLGFLATRRNRKAL